MENKSKMGIKGIFDITILKDDRFVEHITVTNKIQPFKLEQIAKLITGESFDTDTIKDGRLVVSDAQTIQELESGGFNEFKVLATTKERAKNEVTTLFQVFENEAAFTFNSFAILNEAEDQILAFRRLPFSLDREEGGEFEGTKVIITRNERVEG